MSGIRGSAWGERTRQKIIKKKEEDPSIKIKIY